MDGMGERIRAYVRPGDALLGILLALPLVLAWPDAGRLVGASAWLHEAGRLAGVLGLSMMVVAALLSARIPVIERWFGGLPRLWWLHRGIGYAAFILIMLHVLLLAFAALDVSLDAAIATLFPPLSALAIWAGWVAWALLLIAIWPTLGATAQINYQRWKGLHLLAAGALLLALAHGLWLAPQDALWWLLGALGVAAIGWRKLLSPLVARRLHEVTAVERIASDVVEISLQPLQGRMRYEAGQFVYLAPLDPAISAGYGEEHPYTIASAPGDDLVRIGIKDLGDASHALQDVSVGSKAWLEGPYGDLLKPLDPSRRQLWIGGGIGITPFVSGARARARRGAAGMTHAHLFYLADRPERAYYLDMIAGIANDTVELDVTVHYFSDLGPVTAAFLQEHCDDCAAREAFICGPPAMIAHVRKVLEAIGIPRHRVHAEVFDFL